MEADELQSEAKAESEPECKRPRCELKDMDDEEDMDDDAEESDDAWSISTFGPDSDSEWGGHRSEWEPVVESVNYDDLQYSDLCTMHDNNPLPIAFRNNHCSYKNPAMIALEKAYDEHLEQARKLKTGPWDAVPPPHNLGCVGGVRPYDITDENRPRFNRYCKLSLNKYNADNQGSNYVFHELVKATSLVACPLYYITFMAKDASNNNNNVDALTFQAKVSDKVETQIILCMIKPN